MKRLLLVFSVAETLFTQWSEWSICDKICGLGSRRRVRICQHSSCIDNPLTIEKRDCLRVCPTDPNQDPNRSACPSGHEVLTLHSYNVNGAINCHQGFEDPLVDLKFNSIIPFTVYNVYVNKEAQFNGINIIYKIFGSSEEKYHHGTLSLIDGVKTYTPPQPMEVTEFKVQASGHAYYPFCFQCTVTGCQRPLVAEMEFQGEMEYDFTDEQPSHINLQCITHFHSDIDYSNLMSVMNLRTNQKVTSDQSKPICIRNIKIYGSTKRLIMLFINTNHIQHEFDCFDDNGMRYCLIAFSCNGRVQYIDNQNYGHYNPATALIKVIYDKNECLNTNVGCNPDHGICMNTKGSFYCSCTDPFIGDGYSCYTRDVWVNQQHGVYATDKFKEFEIPDIYCRGLFYANVSDELFACSKYQVDSPYGCLRSDDFGSTWKEIHPRLDIIIGQDVYTGRMYGYSTLDTAYIMYDPLSQRWYSIQKKQLDKLMQDGHLIRDKVLMPTFKGIDLRHDENRFPLPQAIVDINNQTFAVTSHGITRKSADKWELVLKWQNLPRQ